MPHIEGKTINELLRVEDITGAEIIPMAVFNEEIGSYVTRGITLDNLFKTIYGMIQDAESSISYIQDDMSAYVSELRHEDARLDNELDKTNLRVAYNSEDLVLMHEHYHRLSSYSYENIGELWEQTGYASSYAYENIAELYNKAAYANENIGELWNANEELSSYAHEGIGKNAEDIAASYEALNEAITASYESLEEAITASYIKLDDSMQVSYEKLFDYISYVAAYAEGGTGELAYQVKELHAYSYENVGGLWDGLGNITSYAYEGIGKNSYINLRQDITLMQHENAIGALAQGIAYESYVNTIQSGHINTIYYENSDDAFNDWSDPDDDNVKPQP